MICTWLFTFWQANITLSSLNLQSNNIGDAGARALAAALQKNAKLSSLNLQSNNIGYVGVRALVTVLRITTALTSLDLARNHFGDAGAMALATMIQTNTTILTSINLNDTGIGAVGATALFTALQTNTTLTELNLDGNSFGNADGMALVTALQTNTALTSLVGVPCASLPIAQALMSACRANRGLTQLHFDILPSASHECAVVCFRELEDHPSLRQLMLKCNDQAAPCSAKTLQALAQFVRCNTLLQTLHVRFGPSAGIQPSWLYPVRAALRCAAIPTAHIECAGHPSLGCSFLLGDRLCFRRALGLLPPSHPPVVPPPMHFVRTTLPPDTPEARHKLGKGHFAAAYAFTQSDGRDACLKVLHGIDQLGVNMAMLDPAIMAKELHQRVEMAMSEFAIIAELGERAMTQLKPYCVFAEQFGVQDDGRLATVLPLMSGGSLEETLTEAPLPMLLFALQDAAAGLSAVHNVGLLHRDVAARNVLLEQMGSFVRAKMSDFGLCAHAEYPDAPNEVPVNIWAPECVAGKKPYTFACDVWQFGLLVVEVFNGVAVYTREGTNHAALLAASQQMPLDLHSVLDDLLTKFSDAIPAEYADQAGTRLHAFQKAQPQRFKLPKLPGQHTSGGNHPLDLPSTGSVAPGGSIAVGSTGENVGIHPTESAGTKAESVNGHLPVISSPGNRYAVPTCAATGGSASAGTLANVTLAVSHHECAPVISTFDGYAVPTNVEASASHASSLYFCDSHYYQHVHHQDQTKADAADAAPKVDTIPLTYLIRWQQSLVLIRPELFDGTPYHTMLRRALSGLVRWCTALDPRQRPSMLMVACILQVLPLGGWDRLAGLYNSQRDKCPWAPPILEFRFEDHVRSQVRMTPPTIDEMFLEALAHRRQRCKDVAHLVKKP